MPLDLDEVADYLLDRKLVKPQAIVEGEFRVENVSRLNRGTTFTVTLPVARQLPATPTPIAAD